MENLILKKRVLLLLGISSLFGCVFFVMATSSFAADMEFKSFIAISEELNNNIYGTQTNRRKEIITRLRPGVTFRYNAPKWNWDLAYTLDYLNYARNSTTDEFNHDASLKGNLSLVDNFFYLDLSERFKRVSLDITRDVTEESPFLNQTDQNIATLSPYLLWRLGEKTNLKTGYSYSDTRYKGRGINRREHIVFADLKHEVTSKLSTSAGYEFGTTDTDIIRFDRHDFFVGFRYEYTEKLFLFGQIGNSWQSFSSGSNVNNLFWNAGVTHDLGIAVVTLETSVEFSEDPITSSTKETIYSGKIDKAFKRGAVGFSTSYSEYVLTETDTNDRSKLSFAAHGNYEVLPSLTASLSGTAERFSRKTDAEYPYRFIAIGGLSYALNDDLSIGLTYTYLNYTQGLDNFDGARETNRLVVDLKKSF